MTSGGIAEYLVDTNVPFYAYDATQPVKRVRAIAVLGRLGRRGNAAVSTQVLGEFYWNATRKLRPPLPPDIAERSLVRWMHSWIVFDLTSEIVFEAIRGTQRYQFPYWDALIWATAKLNAVPTVLSEDFNDGSTIEGVRFLNPFRGNFDPASL